MTKQEKQLANLQKQITTLSKRIAKLNERHNSEHLVNRLDSQSKRICRLSRMYHNFQNNQRYYIQKRLPGVLKNQKVREKTNRLYNNSIKVLARKLNNQIMFPFLSTSKSGRKRFIGFFSRQEMNKLRWFMDKNISAFGDFRKRAPNKKPRSKKKG